MQLYVVIPFHNEKATIEALIHAVRRAPVNDIEIIVVDDCSTDGTRDVLHRVPAAVLGLVFLSGGASRRVAFRAAAMFHIRGWRQDQAALGAAGRPTYWGRQATSRSSKFVLFFGLAFVGFCPTKR
jgi:glycosyltransferase involved in cell wall biosynthesis